MDDASILALYKEREETAIDITDAQYGDYCRCIARQILPTREDVEECVNDAYFRVWCAIPPASPPNLKLYLGKIVRHVAIHTREKQTAQKRGGGQYTAVLEELEACLPSGETPESITDSLVIRQILNQFLDALSLTDKTVFLRRYWYLDSVAAIAKRVHKSENHVHVILHRTRKALRQAFEKEGISL